MSTLQQYYDLNPISAVDQNQWTERDAAINLEAMNQFRNRSLYTPMIGWEPQLNGAQTTFEYDMIPGDVDGDEIPMTANYVDATGVDSRMRSWTVTRYGDKVQLHKSSNVFQQWTFGGGRDWRPVLQGVLGDNLIGKYELLSRNIFLRGAKTFWTYAGDATSIATLDGDNKFQLDAVNAWNLRLGQTGAPMIPGDSARAKVAIVPPGVIYDFFAALPGASANEASLWRDAVIYGTQTPLLNYEIGSFKNIRFLEAPNDSFGMNPNVLYNAGTVGKQYGVVEPIKAGDGAPDPSTTLIDGVWRTGQQNVTHYIKLEDFADGDFAVNDIVTIHLKRTNAYGVTSGLDFLDGKLINRRVVAVDFTANTISFDRPILRNFTAAFTSTGSVTGATPGAFYAYVTKARHVGMVLVLGDKTGVKGKMVEPVKFYEPKPVDDFDSLWRFSWDSVCGWNVADPHKFEVHFCSVTLPKPGGLISAA